MLLGNSLVPETSLGYEEDKAWGVGPSVAGYGLSVLGYTPALLMHVPQQRAERVMSPAMQQSRFETVPTCH